MNGRVIARLFDEDVPTSFDNGFAQREHEITRQRDIRVSGGRREIAHLRRRRVGNVDRVAQRIEFHSTSKRARGKDVYNVGTVSMEGLIPYSRVRKRDGVIPNSILRGVKIDHFRSGSRPSFDDERNITRTIIKSGAQ